MDLARELLIQISEDSLRSDDWGDVETYHLKMLSDVGYIQGITFLKTYDGLHFGLANPQLTWTGHEFLDTIRSNTIWTKIKKFVNDKGADLSVEAIKLAASSVLASTLK
jgi:hypothetical protein